MTIKGRSDSPEQMRSQNQWLQYLGIEHLENTKAGPSLTVSQYRATLLQSVETERGGTRGRGYSHGERR